MTVEVNAGAIPEELRERDRWLLWDASADTPRRPHWRGDFNISWSDPGDWHTIEEAIEAAEEREGWGIGYVFTEDGDHYAIDIDGPFDEDGEPREWFPGLGPFEAAGAYMERSPGDGIHIPVRGEPPEWWRDCEVGPDKHQGVEALENKFCTFTGDALEASGGLVTEIAPDRWFTQVYHAIRGELPNTDGGHESEAPEVDLSEADVKDALGHIDPDVAHNEWRDLAYAVHDWDDGTTGKSIFEDWSRGGAKWDPAAERSIEWIWDHATAGSGVTTGTLVHYAKEGGWDPPWTGTASGGDRPNDPQGDTMDVALTPGEVAAWAGIGEDDSLSDLPDREKAAAVWGLIHHSDEVYVCVRPETDGIWAYEDGVWTRTGERQLRHAGRQALGSMNFGANVVTELKAQARSDPRHEVPAEEFGVEAGTIAVANGLVDLRAAAAGEADALRELRPDDYAQAQLPVEYDPEVTAMEWREYVQEWAEDGRAEALQEYVGYCLHVGAMPIHRALLLVGPGANGKSTFLNVVRELLGEANTTSTELQTLAQERDALAGFEGAVANIDDDLSARKLDKGMGIFKKMTAGDRVRGRRLYESGFTFAATGKHLYAANEVPDVDVPDEDEAFWRRWLIVEFPNYYPPSQRDHTLGDRLTADEVMSGVLNWAIEGWARLLEQGHFTNEDRLAHAKRERWQSWGDSVDQFIATCIEKDPDADRISTGDVYDVYTAWCHENDEDPATPQALTTSLKTEDLGYKQSLRIGGGSPQRGFKRLGFTDEAPIEQVGEDARDGQVTLP